MVALFLLVFMKELPQHLLKLSANILVVLLKRFDNRLLRFALDGMVIEAIQSEEDLVVNAGQGAELVYCV